VDFSNALNGRSTNSGLMKAQPLAHVSIMPPVNNGTIDPPNSLEFGYSGNF
jgi:hypothetical protein